MTVAEQQKRLNQELAQELDKYQVMLEYGRMLLDRDKQIRKSYKWVTLAKCSCLGGAAIDLGVAAVTALLSSDLFVNYLTIMLAIFVISIFVFVAILYKNRNKISKLIDDDEKETFVGLMNELQEYLYKLGEWLKDVDSHIQQKSEVIRNIEKELAVAKSKQANDVNKISIIQGKLDEAIDNEARRIASLRLQPFKAYIYENE